MKRETSINKFKEILIEMFRGYPESTFFGVFNKMFGDRVKEITELLIKDGLIEKYCTQYKLTPKGINFAISMINLEYSEKILKYSETMKKLTYWIIGLSILTIVVGILSLFI